MSIFSKFRSIFESKEEDTSSRVQFDKEIMLEKLNNTDRKLSSWLAVLLEGITILDDTFYDRISFLFRALSLPEENFVHDLRHWVTSMEYSKLTQCRSEIQYRLSVVLGLEDEEDERDLVFYKINKGLAKTKEQFSRKIYTLLSSSSEFDSNFWEQFEEICIMADIGPAASMLLIERVKKHVFPSTTQDEFVTILQNEIEDIFACSKRIVVSAKPEIIMLIGVNGAGKTTTIAKLAYRKTLEKKKVLLVAADTFRAAAIEQLQMWSERVGVDFFAKKQGADPASVAFEALDSAFEKSYDTILIDTAGRLQTKVNLMQELQKIYSVIGKKSFGAPHKIILILDATVGQNGLSQVKLFNEICPINEIILTKLDGTAKGGIALGIALQYDIPISYIGLGEKMEDLRPFNPEYFAKALSTI
ncbi:MAG: signal recognition particle-docking protein FtsY [Desulfovibrionaceae bacterium]